MALNKRGIDSPRHRYACNPSLRKRKEGILILISPSLCEAERVFQRSVDRESQLYAMLFLS
jgi:hypothetical protein